MDGRRPRQTRNWGLAAAGLVLACAAAVSARAGQERELVYKPLIPVTDPAIAALRPAGDAVGRLAARLARGEFTLARHDDLQGYLPAVLTALDVPIASQLLVFSKTSVQAAHISPARPRAIYFRDDVMVAHVPGTPGLEAVAIDPARGPVFYALGLDGAGRPTLTASDTCLKCHHGPNTAGVPGVFVGSVRPGPDGAPLRDDSAIITDHTTPFAERWGGWYVTASAGEPPSRANALAPNPGDRASLVRDARPNLTTLFGLVDPAQFLAPTSDVVALLTLEHQTQAQNLITRVAWQTRVAEAARPGRALTWPALDRDIADLVDYLTFAGEARLPAPVRGVSPFTTTFAARGARDGQGRSLREFDLRTRLFRYPLSYLVQSEAFTALPPVARTEVLRRIHARLTSEPAPGAEEASRAERRAAVAIAAAVLPDLPPFWHAAE